MSELAEYAITDQQKTILELSLGGMSRIKIGKELDITVGVVSNAMRTIKNRAARQGYSPEHDMTRSVPDTHLCKGTSTYYDGDGNVKAQWVKSTINHKRLEEFARQLSESITETVKPVKPKAPAKKLKDADVLNVIPLADFHFGLYAFAEEAQESWDCKIAEEVLDEAFSYVLGASPLTDTLVIANLGDFFHMDTPKNVTNSSGHQLDVDSRWSKVVIAGVRILVKLIDSGLSRHNNVHVINSKGNHDEQSSFLLAIALTAHYRNEPRVTIDPSPDVFHYYEFGQNLIGMHHGHLVRKPDQLYKVMTEDKREEYGRCSHHTWLCGHIHHTAVVETGSMRVESFSTIIPRDNYAHSNGYRAGRSLQAISYHKDRGECSRVKYNIALR